MRGGSSDWPLTHDERTAIPVGSFHEQFRALSLPSMSDVMVFARCSGPTWSASNREVYLRSIGKDGWDIAIGPHLAGELSPYSCV
jgi:hypothetical protein